MQEHLCSHREGQFYFPTACTPSLILMTSLSSLPQLLCLPRERLQGTTSTPVVPVFFGRKISNVGGVNHKNKPAQRVSWRFLSLKKYKIVFFGPILLEL